MALGEAATVVNVVKVASDSLNLRSSSRGLEVESIADSTVACGIHVLTKFKTLTFLDELSV